MTEQEFDDYCTQQKAKYWNSAVVLKKVRDLFPSENPIPIMWLLDSCNNNNPRIQLAILKCCHGDLGNLPATIEITNGDFRDVVLPAEYYHYCSYVFESDSNAVPLATYQKDLDEYVSWIELGKAGL